MKSRWTEGPFRGLGGLVELGLQLRIHAADAFDDLPGPAHILDSALDGPVW